MLCQRRGYAASAPPGGRDVHLHAGQLSLCPRQRRYGKGISSAAGKAHFSRCGGMPGAGGAGSGKAAEDPEAIRKGKEDAIKKLIEVPMDENKSIPHDFEGKFGSANVLLKRAPGGTGIIAGGPARAVLELAGYKNIRTKSLGSNNKQNVVLATIAGLGALTTPEEVAKKRGKSVEEILA